MKITTIGRDTIGGTLGRLWTSAGHEVTELGRDGGDAADADVVLLAVPDEAVPDALASVTGLHGKVVLDATNRVGVVEHSAPAGYPSIAEYVKAQTGGPTAKAFNLNSATCSIRPPQPRLGQTTFGSAMKAPERPSSSSAVTSAWNR